MDTSPLPPSFSPLKPGVSHFAGPESDQAATFDNFLALYCSASNSFEKEIEATNTCDKSSTEAEGTQKLT